MKIILSTRNPSKAKQIRAVFIDLPVSILTLADAGIKGEAVEDGKTLQENALKKASFAHENDNTNAWTMADDTGLFIDALGGEPGMKAARWAGETATTDEITQYTLRHLEGKTDRTATFETAVSLISPNAENYFFSGKVKGQLLDKPRCKPQSKMPYSPLFMPDGENKVWAEMTVEYENKVSHRGKAFRHVHDFIEKILKEM